MATHIARYDLGAFDSERPSPAPQQIAAGDTVNVLNAFRLPHVQEVRHTGVVQRVEEFPDGRPTLYWISGLAVARTLPVLRLVRKG